MSYYTAPTAEVDCKEADLQQWLDENIKVDGGYIIGQEIVSLDPTSPDANDQELLPPTPSSPPSMALSVSPRAFHRGSENQDKGSPTVQANPVPIHYHDYPWQTNDEEVMPMPTIDEQLLYPDNWVVPPVIDTDHELYGHQDIPRTVGQTVTDNIYPLHHQQLPQTMTATGVSEDTAAVYNALSYDHQVGLWSTSETMATTTTATTANMGITTSASFGGVDMTPSTSFSSTSFAAGRASSGLAATTMARTASGGFLDAHGRSTNQQGMDQPTCFNPSWTSQNHYSQPTPYSVSTTIDTPTPASSASSIDPHYFPNHSNHNIYQQPAIPVPTNDVPYHSVSSAIASAADMQSSLSAQSASSGTSSYFSQSVRHPLFAPSRMPVALLHDPLDIENSEAENNSRSNANQASSKGKQVVRASATSNNNSSRAARRNGKRALPQADAADKISSRQPAKKNCRTPVDTADTVHNDNGNSTNARSRFPTPELFDIDEYVYLPLSKAPSMDPPSLELVHQHNQHQPLTSNEDPLGLLSADNVGYHSTGPISTPENHNDNNHDGTISPKDLHIQPSSDFKVSQQHHEQHHRHQEHQGHLDQAPFDQITLNDAYYFNDEHVHPQSQHHQYPQPALPVPHDHHNNQGVTHGVPAHVLAPEPQMDDNYPIPAVAPALTAPPMPSANTSITSAQLSVLQQRTNSQQLNDSEKQERKNAMLLYYRDEVGLTYQEIRRIGKFTEAESTLRGRYRTLTKPKQQRVRKPQWTPKDDGLLLETVTRMLRGRSLSEFKISWKAVADSIVEGGGSYHFGNTTCRKRYDKLVQQNIVSVQSQPQSQPQQPQQPQENATQASAGKDTLAVTSS